LAFHARIFCAASFFRARSFCAGDLRGIAQPHNAIVGVRPQSFISETSAFQIDSAQRSNELDTNFTLHEPHQRHAPSTFTESNTTARDLCSIG